MLIIMLLAISGGLLLVGLRLWKIIFWTETNTSRPYGRLSPAVELPSKGPIFEEWYERASLALNER